MAGRRRLTLENAEGVWKRAQDGRFGWEFEAFFPSGERFRKAGSRSTLADAQASYRAAKEEFEGGPKSEAVNRSLESWAEYCLDTLFPMQGTSARELDNRRSSFRRHWNPALGRFALDAITKPQVREVLRTMEKESGLSYDGRRNARNHLSAVYRAAQAEFKGFTENPADVEIGSRPKRNEFGQRITHKRTLTAEEQTILLDKAKGDPYWIGIFIGLKLGLRRGEILGLRWCHVDFEENVIHVFDNVQRATGVGLHIRDTKTGAGTRRVPMPACVRLELELRKKTATSDYIMPSALGAKPEPRKFSQAMSDFVTLAELRGSVNRWGEPLPDPTLHDLRHTFASTMANVYKVGPKTLQQLMGHEDVKTTLEYYVEASDEDLSAAMALVLV